MTTRKPPKEQPQHGGRPVTTGEEAAEQARRHAEEEEALRAKVTIREHMVDIGRGGQQAGRQNESRTS